MNDLFTPRSFLEPRLAVEDFEWDRGRLTAVMVNSTHHYLTTTTCPLSIELINRLLHGYAMKIEL